MTSSSRHTTLPPKDGPTPADAGSMTVKDASGRYTTQKVAETRLLRKSDHRIAENKPGMAKFQKLVIGPGLELSYVAIATHSASENSDIVRRGIRADFVKQLATDLEIDQSMLTDHMGIARSTFSRKLKNDELLSTGDGAIALGVARIVGEVDRILRESGDPEQMGEDFHVAEWTGHWLRQPVKALGNRRPLDYLDNAFGQETVLQLIRQMQSGAYA